ncbi:hypothetical protein [Mucilaginibacter terrae]|uniref:LytTR family transcriptional regulator n=1 Tax=Mucilaginibacter terrae TaxID=1955052 RepID=A0ABU3GUR0_9SPHI|nr:hypothetical protein [Mucilaginibacter terrae]MDT3403509.1 hypothetical protein [Mucilaginibacter terrae]
MENNQWVLEIAVLLLLIFVVVFHPGKLNKVKQSPDVLLRKYYKWWWISIVMLAVFWPLMTWGIGKGLQYLMMMETDDNPRIKYQAYIDGFTWYFPAAFLAVALSYFPVELLCRIVVPRQELAEYSPFITLRTGADELKIWKPMALVLVSMALIMVFLMSDYYIKIWNYKIEINAFTELSAKEYNFKQIKKITYVEYSRETSKYSRDTNRIVENPHHHILFSDGYLWDTNKGTLKMNKEKEVVNFLSNRCNIHVDTLWVDDRN